MSRPNNPHDLFFKRSWSQLDLARGFLARYLPPEVLAELGLSALSLCRE